MNAPTNVLQPPWDELSRQREGATFGIWVFLASELLFFGSLLLLYTAYRVANPDAFIAAGRETDLWYGTVNTAVLMTSSLTMAVAAQAAAQIAASRAVSGRGIRPGSMASVSRRA